MGTKGCDSSRNIGCQAKLRSNPILHNYHDYMKCQHDITTGKASTTGLDKLCKVLSCYVHVWWSGLQKKREHKVTQCTRVEGIIWSVLANFRISYKEWTQCATKSGTHWYASSHTHIPCDESCDPLYQRCIEACPGPNLSLLCCVSCVNSSADMTMVQHGLCAGNIPTQTSKGGGKDLLMEYSEEIEF